MDINILRPYCFFSNLSIILLTPQNIFCSYRIFQKIPYPPPHQRRQSYKQTLQEEIYMRKNTSHALSAHELMIAKFLHVALA